MVLTDLQAALLAEAPGVQVALLDECTSTNDVARDWPSVVFEPQDDDPEREVPDGRTLGSRPLLLVATERQTAGRGRLDRTWQSPPGAGLMFSLAMAVPDGMPVVDVGVVPLMAGAAVVAACRHLGVAACAVKWPNDVVIDGVDIDGLPPKLGGILTERVGDRLIVGVGLNVDLADDEAPTPQATSLNRHGLHDVTREDLLAYIVGRITEDWRELLHDGPADLLAHYRQLCTTLGRQVVVALPGGRQLTGVATSIDPTGRLVVQTPDGRAHPVAAGDVSFVRPAQS